MRAFDAWQRRNSVDEIEKKKNLHVAALYTITEWKEQGDLEKSVESLEEYYETLKDIVWASPEDRKKRQEEAINIEQNDAFLQAGKRNLMKVEKVELPQEVEIEGLAEL
jgi:hypothetical protein